MKINELRAKIILKIGHGKTMQSIFKKLNGEYSCARLKQVCEEMFWMEWFKKTYVKTAKYGRSSAVYSLNYRFKKRLIKTSEKVLAKSEDIEFKE